ncbi:MAG: hypothetical protein QXS93_01710 [Candidatus Micrarchaeia archaeon]
MAVQRSLQGKCSTCERCVDNIQKKNLFFERKVSYSGRSLIISVPEDLAKYMGIAKGKTVRIVPVDRKKFIVEVE